MCDVGKIWLDRADEGFSPCSGSHSGFPINLHYYRCKIGVKQISKALIIV